MRIRGLQQTISNLKKAVARKGASFEAGCKLAGAYVLAESKKLVPVDYGHLKSTGFVRATGKGAKLNVVVGYSANYAIYVHEDLEKLHGKAFNDAYAAELAKHPKTGPFRHSRGPNQQAKFLEVVVKTKRLQIKAIIADRMKR